MQIVINMPDDEYKAIKNSTRPLYYVEHLVKEGTPLEQEPTIGEIRTRIEKLKAKIPKETMYGGAMIHGMDMVLRMFDEYKTERED
jgi:hypothetical protein